MVKEGGFWKRKKIMIWVVFIIIFLSAVYLTFFYTYKCKDIACWEYKMQKCSKASYFNDAKEIAWSYKIKGKQNGDCLINVRVYEVKHGLTSSLPLEGKDMDCLLPLGTITPPESNPLLCHGILKEEMQNLIIQKLHQYIVQNVGQIGKELASFEGITQKTITNNTGVSNQSTNKTY